jgi:hypothetical protein
MICPQCNAENPDNAAFCSLCYCQFGYPAAPQMEAQQYAPYYPQPIPRETTPVPSGGMRVPAQTAVLRQPQPSGNIGGILGTDGMTADQFRFELINGGKCVVYEYCISAIFVTFKRTSPVFFIRSGESAVSRGVPYTLISFFLGWWGFPFGFIYTPAAIFNNTKGGTDVTREVMPKLNALCSQGMQGLPGPLM